MSKLINNVHLIHNNPFLFTPLITEFFVSSQPRKNDILLAYLILPLVLYGNSRKFLISSKSTSSINTFSKSRKNLWGLPDRVSTYKEITNHCIQYALDTKIIKIDSDLSIEILGKSAPIVPNLKKQKKASKKLHNIFKNLDVVVIYRLLGLKEL